MKELWLPVVGFEGLYEVSNFAQVRSLRAWRGVSRRLMSPYHHNNGYPMVDLYVNGVRKKCTVHQLVMEAFVGPRPEDMHIRHGEAGQRCSYLSNLSYGTSSDNNGVDKRRDGTDNRGEKHNMVKVTESQVVEIRARCATGEMQKDLALEYGLTTSALNCIVLRKSWKHV